MTKFKMWLPDGPRAIKGTDDWLISLEDKLNDGGFFTVETRHFYFYGKEIATELPLEPDEQ